MENNISSEIMIIGEKNDDMENVVSSEQILLGKSYSDWASLIGPRLKQILERHAKVRQKILKHLSPATKYYK